VRPVVAYHVRVDSARHGAVDVTLHVENAAPNVRLAMKVHQEYDARFWRYLELGPVTGTSDDRAAGVTRRDTTLWEVRLPGGRGDIHYTLRFPADSGRVRAAWRTVVRDDGALLNPPDVLLYLPDFADAPATVELDAPRSWRVATSLDATDSPRRRRAPNAATLLDAPILLGALREWTFRDGGTTFAVDYWPLPDAAPFDTTAFVDAVRRLSHAALGVFGSLPSPAYHFLVQDGADDALEHAASVTIGVPSAELARDPRARLGEIAHEFFHTWNLVAIHPDTYGELTYRRTPPTAGLWLGEGVTLHYADVLPRRAGLVDTAPSPSNTTAAGSRAAHLASLVSRYVAAPWAGRVSPEAASLAFGESLLTNPNATGGYYLQGELLGEALDALVRDSTRDRRTLDDVMRALYARSRAGRGVSAREIESTASAVCGCRLDRFFATQVRGPGPIDLAPAAARLGWRLVIDTIAAVDDRGAPVPDTRLSAAPVDGGFRLVVTNPASAWARAGLRTGDEVVSFAGVRPATFGELLGVLRRLRVGDTAAVDVRRGGASVHFDVAVRGFDRPRARLVDAPSPTAEQLARRARWLAGW
jgi:predicted metalloprotease with PDZ domain